MSEQETNTAGLQPAADDASPANPPVKVSARLAIVIVVCLFVAMVGSVYYFSWWKAPRVPTVILTIEAPEELKDASIFVDLPEGGWIQSSLLQQTFDGPKGPEIRHQCSFNLPPGIYDVRVRWRGRSQSFAVDLPEVAMRRTLRLPKPKDIPATAG